MSWIAYHEGVLKILGVQVGFGNLDLPHIIMILVGLGFITLAITTLLATRFVLSKLGVM